MLKIAAEGIAPRLAACCSIGATSAQSSCHRIAPQAAKATQKYLSQSQHLHKMLVIKDHYEFDQKVSQDYAMEGGAGMGTGMELGNDLATLLLAYVIGFPWGGRGGEGKRGGDGDGGVGSTP